MWNLVRETLQNTAKEIEVLNTGEMCHLLELDET